MLTITKMNIKVHKQNTLNFWRGAPAYGRKRAYAPKLPLLPQK
jgi:hypothetical protein